MKEHGKFQKGGQNESQRKAYRGRRLPQYALALAEHVLDGRGAVRIHGGGFGGTIQAFVPLDLVDTFITKMNGWLGEGSARHYAISDKGAYAAWL